MPSNELGSARREGQRKIKGGRNEKILNGLGYAPLDRQTILGYELLAHYLAGKSV